MTGRAVALVTLSLSMMVAMGTSAQAQRNPLNPFGPGRGPRLNNDDFQLLDDSAARLLNKTNLAPGQEESWSNPTTGSSGTVTVTRSFARHGLNCQALRYRVSLKTVATPRIYDLDWCKTEKGEWRISH